MNAKDKWSRGATTGACCHLHGALRSMLLSQVPQSAVPRVQGQTRWRSQVLGLQESHSHGPEPCAEPKTLCVWHMQGRYRQPGSVPAARLQRPLVRGWHMRDVFPSSSLSRLRCLLRCVWPRTRVVLCEVQARGPLSTAIRMHWPLMREPLVQHVHVIEHEVPLVFVSRVKLVH
jgi:hypothetical protein